MTQEAASPNSLTGHPWGQPATFYPVSVGLFILCYALNCAAPQIPVLKSSEGGLI